MNHLDVRKKWSPVFGRRVGRLGGVLMASMVLAPACLAQQPPPISSFFDPFSAFSDASQLAPLFAPPESLPTSASGPVLAAEAKQAFEGSFDAIGRQLMLAHLVTEYEDAIATLQGTKFSPLLKRPVWNMSCGFSIAVRGNDEITDFSPITASSQQYSGDREPILDPGNPLGSDSSETAPDQSLPTMQAPPTLDLEAASFVGERLGLVAEEFISGFDERYRSGTFGPLLVDVSPSRGATIIGDIVEHLSNAPEPLPMYRPGLSFLGESPSKEAVQIAKANGIDLLFHVDMTLKSLRSGETQNVSRIRLFDVASGQSLGVSKVIDSRETRRQSPGEYVKSQLSSLWRVVDRDIKAVDLPSVGDDVINRRIGALLVGENARSLSTLAEIRLYQSFGVIDQAKVEQAFYIAGGRDAMLLLYGPRNERLKVARKWAVEAADFAESAQ